MYFNDYHCRSIAERRSVADDVLAQPPFGDYPRANEGVTRRVSEQETRDLLEGAGFAVTRMEKRTCVRIETSPEAMIRFSEASSFGNLPGHRPEEPRPQAGAVIKQRLEQIMTPDGIRREGRYLAAFECGDDGFPPRPCRRSDLLSGSDDRSRPKGIGSRAKYAGNHDSTLLAEAPRARFS